MGSITDSKEFIVVGTAIISTTATLVSVALASRLTKNRETIGAERKERKDQLIALQGLYQECVAYLDAHIAQRGVMPIADGDRLYQIKAKMSLLAPTDVRASYEAATETVDQWAFHSRESGPKSAGNGVLIFTSNPAVKVHEEEAQKLWPTVVEKFETLKQSMSEDLRVREQDVIEGRFARLNRKGTRQSGGAYRR